MLVALRPVVLMPPAVRLPVMVAAPPTLRLPATNMFLPEPISNVALMLPVEVICGATIGPVKVPPLNGSALAIPTETVSYHLRIAPIIILPTLFTPEGCMPSGQPSGGVRLLLASVADQLDTSLIAAPTASRPGAKSP